MPLNPPKESQLDIDIAVAMKGVELAKRDLAEAMHRVQERCEHVIVSESPYKSPRMNAVRICNHCRITETGSHWSGGDVWSREDHDGKPLLGNEAGRIVIAVSRDELYSMRVA